MKTMKRDTEIKSNLKDNKTMTTFERYFEENPDQKEIFEKKYKEFLISETMLENRNEREGNDKYHK